MSGTGVNSSTRRVRAAVASLEELPIAEADDQRSGAKWYIVQDKESPFTRTVPFILDRRDILCRFLFGERAAKALFSVTRTTWFTVLLEVGLWFNIVAGFSTTTILNKNFALLSLLHIMCRVAYALQYYVQLLPILVKQGECILLVLSTICATVGLFDAFKYDVRCVWAVDFFVLAIYHVFQDAAKKYRKKPLYQKIYIISTGVQHVSLVGIVSLIYFGFGEDMQNREYVVEFPAAVEGEPQSQYRLSTLSFTIALVQSILLYLLKVPYNISRNRLTLVQVKLHAEKVNASEIQAALAEERDRRRANRSQLETPDTSTSRKKQQQTLGVPITNEWRIFLLKNDFVRADGLYQRKSNETFAQLLGEKTANRMFRLYHRSPFGLLYTFSCVSLGSPLFCAILVGWVPKIYTIVFLGVFPVLVLHTSMFNRDLAYRLLRTLQARTMIVLVGFGSIGLFDALMFDVRCIGVLMFAIAFLIYAVFNDATTKEKSYQSKQKVLMTYFFGWQTVMIAMFRLGYVQDVRNRELNLAELVGRESTLDLSTLGYSLYFLEAVLVFALKNYLSSILSPGFSIIKIPLEYRLTPPHELFTSGYFSQQERNSALIFSGKLKLKQGPIPRPKHGESV